MQEALEVLLRPLGRGVSVDKIQESRFRFSPRKELCKEPKHGVAALDSTELPVSGCYK